jgi:hypothetical protein
VSHEGPDTTPPAAASPAADGVLDLFGVLAYASLTAFFRLSDDAALAISLSDKTALAEMAVAEFGHFQLLRARIEEMSADPWAVMEPFVSAGWKAWSRLMSAMGSQPIFTGRWRRCSTRPAGIWC